MIHALFDLPDLRYKPFLDSNDDLRLDLFEGQFLLRLHYPDDGGIELLFPICFDIRFRALAFLGLMFPTSICELIRRDSQI